jgi:lipopolysaccharide/colanic/teichoic acid biosynthesis glycosyltransferase
MPDRLQRILAAVALVLLSPAMAVVAVAVRLGSPGPILFGATRLGRGGRPFTAWKYRTMVWRPHEEGSPLSLSADPRVTRVGSGLRRTRLDELPQLWNVVRGEMRLVGPRPEDPRFVDLADTRQATVLAAPPGITGLAQLVFADEARLLDPDDPEATYRTIIQPRKLLVDSAYLRNRSTVLDLRIVLATLLVVAGRKPPADQVDRLVGSSDWRVP